MVGFGGGLERGWVKKGEWSCGNGGLGWVTLVIS